MPSQQKNSLDLTRKVLWPVLLKLLKEDDEDDSTLKLNLNNIEQNILFEILWENRISIRALQSIKEYLPDTLQTQIEQEIQKHLLRKQEMLSLMKFLMDEIDINFTFIKTPDNFPDFGHDVDILCLENAKQIKHIFLSKGFSLQKQGLAEKIAEKLNFNYKNSCNIEVHCARLGAMGEHKEICQYILTNKTKIDLEGIRIWAPDYNSRIFLIVLQRMYRHFNIRACDVINVIKWYNQKLINPQQTIQIAKQFGIHYGTILFFQFVNEIYKQIHNQNLFDDPILAQKRCVFFSNKLIRFNRKTLVPYVFLKKILWDISHLKLNPLLREMLIPPIATIAIINLKVFKKGGIW